jgi:hypothetical protein
VGSSPIVSTTSGLADNSAGTAHEQTITANVGDPLVVELASFGVFLEESSVPVPVVVPLNCNGADEPSRSFTVKEAAFTAYR